MFKPRPKQQEVLAFRRGRMGVVAVPGSGKTRTLSALAAQLIAEAPLSEGQEILVVTLVNSAVGNFSRQVGEFIRARDLLPGLGYRVRTLHGLANDIVRERPALAGLADGFTIVDEREADDILQEAAYTWARTHTDSYLAYTAEAHLDHSSARRDWPEVVKDTAFGFIRNAKDRKLVPEVLRERLTAHRAPLPLAEMCLDIYETYERGLRYRGAVDFQDLIRLALRVLAADAGYLDRLRHRWPIILEDEAQDSSQLQEEILRLLVGPEGSWVRVGDPNQAIYETFTTARPEFLRAFLREQGVVARELPNSGRSTRSIIRLANRLIAWALQHPNPDLRARQPLDRPLIEPTPPDDPQGNPPDDPTGVQLRGERFTPEAERAAVIRSLKAWLPEHGDWTVAVLLPINASGSKMVDELRRAGIEYVENLRTTTSTRAVVGSVQRVLSALREPTSGAALAEVYRVWTRDLRDDPEAERVIDSVVRQLKAINQVEDYLAPRLTDWLETAIARDENPGLYDNLAQFRAAMQRWQAAANLPVDQLALTIGGDLFTREAEIATAYSLALYLRRFVESRPDARLPDIVAELTAIAQNQRQFTGMGDDDEGFDPEKHRGKVAVTTVHKAKGLEWDRVYLMSVNNYDFPSAELYDSFIGEKWFVRDGLNLEAEARAQLGALTGGETYREGAATRTARLEYAGERLRLLFVGITRARRELVITWNVGSRQTKEAQEAVALAALRGWWEQEGTR